MWGKGRGFVAQIDLRSGFPLPQADLSYGNSFGYPDSTVVGLTSENFADFNLDMLGLDSEFDWSSIDAVILNPDENDRFFEHGRAIGTLDKTYKIYRAEQLVISGDDSGLLDIQPLNEIGLFSVMTLTNGEAITVANHFDMDGDYAIEAVTFADGISLASQDIGGHVLI